MTNKTDQMGFFEDESEANKPLRHPKKMTIENRQASMQNSLEQRVDTIPRLTLPTRWELLQAKIGTDDASLKTIIRPVPEALQNIRNITEYLRTTSGCQVLVIRADTGSGKTTFLNTLPHYMPDEGLFVQSIDLQFVEEDKFPYELEKITLSQDNINIIILEGREKPESIPDKYIQIVLANINRFSRQKRIPMLFVIPTIEEPVARSWCDHGVRIGDLIPEHKLYGSSRWYNFPGVKKEGYVDIVRETVRVLNSQNIEDFGVSTDELNKWAEISPTIGKFIELVATETTNRRASSMITFKGKRDHVWTLFCAPDYKHYDHTYLVLDGLCHDEKLHPSANKIISPEVDTSTAKFWREPAQWAKLVTTINFLDIRLINFSITAVVSAVLAYGDPETIESFKRAKIEDYKVDIPEEMLANDVKLDQTLLERRFQVQNVRSSLEKSNLFYLLRGMPAVPSRGGNQEQLRTLAQYIHLLKNVSLTEVHFCIGSALDELLRYYQFPGYIGIETETPLLSTQSDPRPDITIHTESDIYALEFHFFSKQFTSSEVSRYTLRSVVDKYIKSLPYLTSQLTQAYGKLK
jgi:hypothetical protein